MNDISRGVVAVVVRGVRDVAGVDEHIQTMKGMGTDLRTRQGAIACFLTLKRVPQMKPIMMLAQMNRDSDVDVEREGDHYRVAVPTHYFT